MKKLLLGFAACALLFTSCQKSEITENISDGQGQLSFSMAMGKQTRAAELTNSTLIGDEGADKNNKMGIWAYESPNSTWKKWFTDNLWYEDSKWQIGSTRFRNTSDTKFYTLWPMGGTSNVDMESKTLTTGSFPSFEYTIPSPQVDLVGGLTDVVANKTDITIKMRHLLSQVNFGTKGYAGAKISIGNIQVVGVNEKATYTFTATDSDPNTAAGRIGAWGTSSSAKTYSYFLPGSSSSNQPKDLSFATPADASADGVNFIFGDGGNWGPGNVKYLNSTNSAWQDKTGTKLSNSLMLMPQSFVGKTAKVTFNYTITDKDGAYVAGTSATPAIGEFKLDFTSSNNTAYASEWKQNMRYVYIIDFTNFLDGNKLTFDVDVEAYEWENYNNGTGDPDDGIVNVPTVYQPTNTDMNDLATTDTWMVATKGTTAPTTDVQLVDNQTWDWRQYAFNGIGKDETVDISFQKVIFNGKTITLTVPTGYTVTAGTGITIDATNTPIYVISAGDKSANAKITIKNENATQFTTLAKLVTGFGELTGQTGLTYKGIGSTAISLATVDNSANSAAVSGSTILFTTAIVPTLSVTATTNGIWRYNSATKTATWTNVTWETTLTTTETAFGNATAGATLYSGNTTAIAANNFATEPTTIANGGKVTILFNNTTVGTTLPTAQVYGTWVVAANSPATGLTTYTYTRNDVLTLVNAQSAFKSVTTNGRTIKCGDVTDANMTTVFGEPTNFANVNTATVVFSAANVNRVVGSTTNGIWTTTDNRTYIWTKVTWNDLAATKVAVGSAAANATIYCSDATADLDMATELDEPTTVTNSPVKVVFSTAASRTTGATTNGAWSYDTASKTATWTKN